MQTIKDLVKYILDMTLELSDAPEENTEELTLQVSKLVYLNPMLRVVRDKSLHSFRANYLNVASNYEHHTAEEVEIAQIVCEVHQVSYEKLFAKGRKREIIDARAQYCSFLYTKLRYSFKRVGLIFGRDHSTIINAVNMHEKLLETCKDYAIKYAEVCHRIEKEIPHLLSDSNIIKEVFENFREERNKRRNKGKKQGYIQTISPKRNKFLDKVKTSLEVIERVAETLEENAITK